MNTVRNKLGDFIRKFYLNRIVKGSIILGISFISLLLVYATIEYFGWLGQNVRAVLFFSYIFINALLLIIYVLYPTARLMGIAKGISVKHAAVIIGSHFDQISDKLLNLLQLQELESSDSLKENELLMAAIAQKEVQLAPFPFVKAIPFQKSIRYLRFLMPGVLVLIAILSFRPDFIVDPVERITNFNVHFEKPAPFRFLVLNKSLVGVAKESYNLSITTEGESIPAEVYVQINGINYKAKGVDKNLFEFEINNLRRDVAFRLNSMDFFSKEHILKVIPKPAVRNFTVKLQYPSYMRKQNETMDNIGDLIVPRGTIVTWNFNLLNSNDFVVELNDKRVSLTKETNSKYSFSIRAMEEINYAVKPVNEFIDTLSKVNYSVEVIPDEYPLIRVDELFDSLNHFTIFFSGEIADDYGFSKLSYHYVQVRGSDTLSRNKMPLKISVGELKQRFMHFSDLKVTGFQPGDQLLYYFEVTDNDQVTGPKSTRSYMASYKIPGYGELDKLQESLEKEIKDKLEETIRNVKAIQQEAKKLNNEMRNKEQITWQDQEKLNQLLNKQQEVKFNIEELQKQIEYKNQKESSFKTLDEDILKKQQQLMELMEKLMDEETQKLLEEIQKLMEALDKDKVNEMLEKMNLTNDELNKELERNLEIFKQLELEKDLKETIEKLNQLAEEQKKLANEANEKKQDSEKLSEEQKELNKKFDDIKEKLDKIEKNNKELEFPNDIKNTDNEKQEISKEMKESLDQLKQGNQKNASQKQQKASDKMKELSDKLSDMMDGMMEEQLEEDIMTLRLILKNLVHLSKEQEALMEQTQKTSRQDPRFSDMINQQNTIKRDFKIIEDSLVALSKRQIAIQSVVSKEISSIKNNMEQAISNLLDVHTVAIINRTGKEKGIERQQFSMTSMNNLALLLAESLDQMKDEQDQQKSKKGKNCKKPKSGAGMSMKQMKQRQQDLNQSLKKMRDQMQKGQEPGKRNSMSEQFARMAAEQEAIRKALGEYMQQLQKQGLKEKGTLNDLMKEMEKTEEELVNKIINNNTLKRQEEIKTRLLESEKAEQEREEEERRESKEVKNQIFGNPALFLEYKRLTEKEQEMLRYSTPLLQLFYKNKVNDFMLKQDVTL